MKTLEDLNALIPTIVDLLRNNDHEIVEDSTCNYLCYEEDGWVIEISYNFCVEWNDNPRYYCISPSCEILRAWGKVTEITASYYDEGTDEVTEFSGDDLNELWSALDEELE